MFCTRTPKLSERGVKNTAGGFGGAGLQWGVDRFIYVSCLSSTSHRKVVQSPRLQREKSGCKTKHCWGLGGAGSMPPSKSGPEPPLCIILQGSSESVKPQIRDTCIDSLGHYLVP